MPPQYAQSVPDVTSPPILVNYMPPVSDPHTCQINDLTLVGDQPWHTLRREAMNANYKETSWYRELRPTNLILLERLREAQLAQDDWNPLPGPQGSQRPEFDQKCDEPDQRDQEQPQPQNV